MMWLFIVISTLYVAFLAAVDGLFNRLVFRSQRKLSYFSKEKQSIYKLKEWSFIGLIFLVILPFVLPVTLAFFIGGFKYVLVYVLVLIAVPWDIIFGKLVFDDYLGDIPSIALPFFGWRHFSLRKTYITRLCLFALILFVFLQT